ncbi:MAG: exosortase/archaeosortase family protein [Opitutales bacterium]|jgi:exosortase/archaeosortase family protein
MMQSDFFRLRPETRLAAWLALGMALVVVLDQWNYWGARDDFSFGYLVPFFVAYVVNDRWTQLKGILLGSAAETGVEPGQPGWAGAALEFVAALVVLGSLVLFAYAGLLRAATGPDNDSAMGLALGLGGFVLAMGFLVSRQDAQGRMVTLAKRWRVVMLLVFPALVWLISAPMLLVFETRIKGVLLEYVVGIVSGLFDFLGYSIYAEGNVLVLPHGRVGVEDACSGIRSLTACLFSGSFLAAVFLDRFWKKVLLLGMSAVLAFVMNVVRSLFLTGWAYAYGDWSLDADFWGHPETLKDAAGQFHSNPAFLYISVHDFAGYTILGFTLVGLLLLIPLLNFKIDLDKYGPPPAPPAQA